MNYEEGARYGAYTLIDRKFIDEYESEALLFRHEKSGCEVYHLVNDDVENVFAFIFKTPPGDNKGTAHIIEHCVLSGSEKYPIKDPFIALTRGSVNTFLNALTYPDKTMYPAATIDRKDFFNMLDVYGDAVFFPLLRRETFHQEGRRYVIDEHGTIDVDGVVYNEMKGNYSTHDSIVGEWSYRSLFPDSPYRFDSGGDPPAIRDLTYEEFVDFHARYYHPSNCRIFLYGNIPSDEILTTLDERFLSRFDRIDPGVDIPAQRRWDAPLDLSLTSPAAAGDETSGKSTITLNWLTTTVHDPLVVLSMEILTEILLGHSGSPLQKAIVESGLGEDISPVSGLDTHTMELVFSVGLRGTDPDKKESFEKLVETVLSDLVTSGIPRETITAALNRVEFRNREIKGGAPFGLRLLGKAIRGWLHDDPPEKTLEFAPWMKKVSEYAAGEGYFESLIRNLFLSNPHRSTVIVSPDPEHESREAKEFEEWKSRRSPTEAERRVIEEDLLAFRTFLETPDAPEDLERVPCLSISDLPGSVECIPVRHDTDGLYILDQYTNGIVYLEMAFDLQDLPEGVDQILPLLCRAVCGAGIPDTPYDEVARLLSTHTGGFTAFLESNSVIDFSGPTNHKESIQRSILFVRMKALESELDNALGLVFDLLLDAELDDTSRMRDLLLELRNDYKSQLLPAGHSYALLRAGSVLSPVLRTEEAWKGISQYLFLNGLAEADAMEDVCRELAHARSVVFDRSRLTVAITADTRYIDRAIESINSATERLPESGSRVAARVRHGERVITAPSYQALETPSSVGYVAQAIPSSKYGEPGHAAEVVASQLLRTGYLWEEVRMRGGAYGVFANANGGEGIFSFSSYRDPNIVKTFSAYRSGLENLAAEGVSSIEAEKAIITVVGREIRPLVPSEKSMVSFRRALYGITDELRQAKRDEVLSLEAEGIGNAAKSLLERMHLASSAVLADPKAISDAAAEIPALGENRTTVPN